MPALWADVRKRLIRAKETEAAFPADDLDEFVSPGAQQATVDVDRLLTDADALLSVVKASQHEHSEHPGLIVCYICAARYRLDNVVHYPECEYAALPEHLK